jgi:hypothetical protein
MGDPRKDPGGEGTPPDLETFGPPAEAKSRQVFLYVISGFKPRNPLAGRR